jgi:hypothetical protein
MNTKDLNLAALLLGRRTIKKNFGDLRTLASQLAHENDEIDEEEFFDSVSSNYLKGIKQEVSEILGTTKASKLLDPFKKNG